MLINWPPGIHIVNFIYDTKWPSKGNYKQNITYGMEENICKWCDHQGINFQNMQIPQTTQQQKNKQTIKKASNLNRHFSKEDIQMSKGIWKMINISNY